MTIDISEYSISVVRNIGHAFICKNYNYKLWFLLESLSLFINYNPYDSSMNILTDEQYQNILNAIKKTLNKYYYEYNS